MYFKNRNKQKYNIGCFAGFNATSITYRNYSASTTRFCDSVFQHCCYQALPMTSYRFDK